MEEMRIGEKEEMVSVNCHRAAGQMQSLGGTSIGSQQQMAVGGFPYQQQPGSSSENRILHYLGSQVSLGQGGGGSQADLGRDGGGGEQALARREGIKKRSKSLKCNKVNLFPLLHWSPIQSYLKTHNCLNLC